MNVVPAPISTMASAAGIGVRALHGLVDRFPHRGTQRVDRRVVDGEDRDAIGDVIANDFSHRQVSVRGSGSEFRFSVLSSGLVRVLSLLV